VTREGGRRAEQSRFRAPIGSAGDRRLLGSGPCAGPQSTVSIVPLSELPRPGDEITEQIITSGLLMGRDGGLPSSS